MAQVHVIYRGHEAYRLREDLDTEDEKGRLEYFQDRLQRRYPGATIGKLETKNLEDPDLPLNVSYEAEIPAFGQRAGRRLLIMPSFFEANRPVPLAAKTRTWPLVFDYGFTEEDTVRIFLPDSMKFDDLTAPSAFGVKGFMNFEPSLTRTVDNASVTYKRSLTFGQGGQIAFPATSYEALKQVFDALHQQDNHQITARTQGSGHAGRWSGVSDEEDPGGLFSDGGDGGSRGAGVVPDGGFDSGSGAAGSASGGGASE